MLILCYTLTCLIICIGGTGNELKSKPYTDYKAETYFVEHAISTVQANAAINSLDLNTVEPKAGCQQCTRQEIRYCLGYQLINDHCCCDKNYNEYFPYIPHTCYIGEKICRPLAKDCAEYTRLRTCCCDKYVLQAWKSRSNAPNISENSLLVILILTFVIILRNISIPLFGFLFF